MPQLSRSIGERVYVKEYNRHLLPVGVTYVGKVSDGCTTWTFAYIRELDNTRYITPAALPAYITQAIMEQAIMESIDVDDAQ
jgi:hypothetical protein